MFSPLDRDQVNRARNADVLRAQRIIGFFILITHKSLRSVCPITWKGAAAIPCSFEHVSRDMHTQRNFAKNVEAVSS